jgi:hypothetical protein
MQAHDITAGVIARELNNQKRTRFVLEPERGATYARDGIALYAYNEYPRNSVLAGQTRRVFISSWDTVEEATWELKQIKVPGFKYEDSRDHSQFSPPNLNHLPDDE